MNRMNPLFLKAFLTPSKNHANHCKTMLYNLNKNAVKSQTAILYPLHNERHDMNMKTKQDALDWALTYLREVVGVEIEDNEEYQKATQINEVTL